MILHSCNRLGAKRSEVEEEDKRNRTARASRGMQLTHGTTSSVVHRPSPPGANQHTHANMTSQSARLAPQATAVRVL